jgi:ABC-type phosphate transport system substrate-binding protein
VVEKLIGLVLFILVIIVGFSTYERYTAIKFTLIKAEWKCTNVQLKTELVPIANGNGSTTVYPLTNEVCVQYSKIK